MRTAFDLLAMPTAQELSLTNRVFGAQSLAPCVEIKDVSSVDYFNLSVSISPSFSRESPKKQSRCASPIVLIQLYDVSADVSQACCTRPWAYTTEITSRKALEGRGYVKIHNSVSHSLRCCYCDRIIYCFHICWLIFWWLFWASGQPSAILRTCFRKIKRWKIVLRGPFSNWCWGFSVKSTTSAFLRGSARPWQQAN